MSITIHRAPTTTNIFAKSEANFIIATADSKTVGSAASFNLAFAEHPAQNHTILFVYNDISLLFTFKNSPDNSGLQLNSTVDIIDNMVYHIRLDFLKNFYIARDFSITQGTGANSHKLYFSAKTRDILSIAITFPVGNKVSLANLVQATIDTYLDNYKVVAIVYDSNDNIIGGPDFFPTLIDGVNSSTGKANINLSDYICSQFLPLPDMIGNATIIKERPDLYQIIKIQFAEAYDSPAEIKALNLNLIRNYYALNGGSGKQRAALLNNDSKFLYELLQNRKQFLSHLPAHYVIDRLMPISLCWLNFSHNGTINVKAKFYTLTSNTTVTAGSLTNCAKYKVYEVNCSLQALNPTYVGTNITHYELWLEDANGIVLSEIRTFKIDYVRQNTRYFKFFNSYGAYDIIRTTGKSTKIKAFEYQIGFNSLDSYHNNTDSERKKINPTTTEVFQINSGLFNVQSNSFVQLSEMFSELFNAEEAYEYTPSGLVPIVILNNELIVSETDENLRSVEFTYEKTYVDNLLSDIADSGNNFGQGGFFGQGFGVGFYQIGQTYNFPNNV
jgi:hypothetical protein